VGDDAAKEHLVVLALRLGWWIRDSEFRVAHRDEVLEQRNYRSEQRKRARKPRLDSRQYPNLKARISELRRLQPDESQADLIRMLRDRFYRGRSTAAIRAALTRLERSENKNAR
jgi:hypothetical protein